MPKAVEKTIAQFIGIIFKTKLPFAQKWLKEHLRAVIGGTGKDVWKKWVRLPITSGSATNLVYGVAARITYDLRHSQNTDGMLCSGRHFLEEIQGKADQLGLIIDATAMDAIIVPRSFIAPAGLPGVVVHRNE